MGTDMDGKNGSYRLYIMDSDKEGQIEATQHMFAKIHKGYVLIYETSAPFHSAELTDQEIISLPEDDKEWLMKCNQIILNNFVLANQDLLDSGREKFLQEFERELEKEMRKREKAYGEE